MSKEHLEVPEKEYLKALDRLVLKNEYKTFDEFDNDYVIVRQALQRLEAIDNAKPSVALELVGYLKDYFLNMIPYDGWLDDIEKYILKAQEQEKVIEIIKKKDVLIKAIKECKHLSVYNLNLEEYRQLTQEEFNLLKRWVNEQDNK